VCSECEGYHHWVECVELDGEDAMGEPIVDAFCGYQCKHCDVRSEQCEGCENPVYPLPAGAQFCPECVTEFN